ncbi:uncharacterized protein LOC107614968 [Arachis ipaensis]|uniref:uncharacterized protein LOC107614968 n=1 Tax=Arachis ipaensis TaxID=130454 RepID=UPI0007AF17A7|nr:uncharacterized protein LOC107614968 [Arachis ipaensis]XP_025678046.1 pre-mRNA-splicing factor CWC22 homolog [Arachis hypogaea]
MEVVLGPGGAGREVGHRGEASVASSRERTKSPPRRTTRSQERRPFGGTGDNSARIMQELRHRMQNLERQLADREHRQPTPESSYSRSPPRSHSQRTASPRSEPESARDERRPKRRRDPIIYDRRERRRTHAPQIETGKTVDGKAASVE